MISAIQATAGQTQEEELTTPANKHPMSEPVYNLLHPDVIADPYPLYRRMLSESPVHWDTTMGRWIILRYADVVATLNSPHVCSEKFNAAGLPDEQHAEIGPLYETLSKQMLFMDPPQQSRLRALAVKSFTPRVIEGMRARMQLITDQLLDDVAENHQMDAIQDLAYPLPAIVIAELMGVPAKDRDRFKRWSDDLAIFLGTFHYNWEEIKVFLPSLYQLMDYLHEIVAQTRRDPQDNLLSALILAEEQGDKLTEDELIANCMLILAAGHETTTNLIGNGLLALGQFPLECSRLKADPSLLAQAIEEMLRYESPVQWTSRVAKAPMEIGGIRIDPGQFLQMGLGAANRDPLAFSDPGRLNFTRKEGRHLAFGYGPHFCIGAALARMEGQIAIGTLLRRFPDLEIDTDTVTWNPNFTFRGLKSLAIRWA